MAFGDNSFRDIQRRVVTVNLPLNGDCVDQCVFIADAPYQVVSIREVHAVAGNDAGAVTVHVEKDTGTGAPGAGTTVQTGTFNLKGTANTVQSGVLSATLANTKLAAGDRLSLDFTGTITTLAGVQVTIQLRRTGF